ncbi:alpha/beta hydrolase [Yinghuangia seranimata]|uniref:alpha/beta hydrolase n=1 Tax=Yinghuangia seranimata TaxID=408067 RepID=UPI00248B2EAE|nr:alpha/beta hydrolase [Yinghuangia seranimata]MDI2128191.1 alpha/beta hydrolase [Yinghuangia seranimata]
MVNVYQLRDARLLVLGDAVHKWHLLVTALDTAEADAAKGVAAKLRASAWLGQDADAAYRNLDRLDDDLRLAAAEARLVFTALERASSTLDQCQRDLRPLLDQAAGKFFVTENGDVLFEQMRSSPGALPEDVNAVVAENHAMADGAARLQASISAIMKRANDADNSLAGALAKLDVAARNDTTLASWQDLAADTTAVAGPAGVDLAAIPKNNPQAAAAWWNGLTDTQRQQYLALAPQEIGHTNGLPSDVRDRANRIALKEAKVQAQKELDDAQAKFDKYKSSKTWERWAHELQDAKHRMEGITSLESKLDSQEDIKGHEGTYIPPAFLLDFSPETYHEDGTAVVAIGNPDTSQHTAVYVPGTGVNLPKIDESIDRTRDLWMDTQKFAGPDAVSTVMWLGHDMPDNVVQSAPRGSVDGVAPPLRQFVDGVNASHQGPPAHTTVIGHSIGSTAVGVASQGHPLPVQDIVAVGSPGMHVDDASGLGMPPGHVWSALADGDDLVSSLGRMTHGGHGADLIPSDTSFGANRFRTDGAHGHFEYMDENESRMNIAKIVTQHYSSVSLKWGTPP